MTITKYRVYFDFENKDLGYIEYTSNEGLDKYEIITETIDEND
jgi:hypothetical protein